MFKLLWWDVCTFTQVLPSGASYKTDFGPRQHESITQSHPWCEAPVPPHPTKKVKRSTGLRSSDCGVNKEMRRWTTVVIKDRRQDGSRTSRPDQKKPLKGSGSCFFFLLLLFLPVVVQRWNKWLFHSPLTFGINKSSSPSPCRSAVCEILRLDACWTGE